MPPITLLRSIVTIAAVMLASISVAAAQTSDPPMEKSITYRVVIGPDGKLVSAMPTDSMLGADIQRAAVGLAKELKFSPALAQGKPASSETGLTIVVQFIRKPDNSYQLALKTVRLATEVVKRVPPVYQWRSKKDRPSSFVILGVLVRADGSVDPAQTRVLQSAIHAGSEADLAKVVEAAKKSAAEWTYKPDLVGGQPVSSLNLVHVRFCGGELGGCDKPEAPQPTTEMTELPKSVSAGLVLPTIFYNKPAAPPALAGDTHYVQMRISIDAKGAVTAMHAVGKIPEADAVEAVRARLQRAPFIPAQSGGRAASSEMTVTVPVRDERKGGGGLRVQLERIRYDFQLVAAPFPWIPTEMSSNQVDARTRYRVVTGPDGRADPTQSKVEMLELSPNAPGMRRKLEANILESIRYIRVEPVLVDGKAVPISFVRGMYFCSDDSRGCAYRSLDEATMKAANAPPTLPPGVILARLLP